MKKANILLIAESFSQLQQKEHTDLNVALGYGLALRDQAENLATILKLDNPSFDRDNFLKACGF